MKNYRITVNGVSYDVSVEETGEGSAPAVQAPVVQSTPKAAPAPAKAAAKPAGGQGGTAVNSPMPGKILSVKATVGQSVKRGDVIMILEAMKMENEVVATADGTIASINVGEGASVEAGEVLATLN